MSILDRFKKGTKAESTYFEQRKGDEGSQRADVLPPYLARTEKKLTKDLFIDLLRLMKSHDLKASVGVFANTTDNLKKETGLVINKGVVPKKIVSYLQEMRMTHIEQTLKYVRETEPDRDGFYSIDDRLAARLNLPADVMIFPVFSATRTDLGLFLVARQGAADLPRLTAKLKKQIR